MMFEKCAGILITAVRIGKREFDHQNKTTIRVQIENDSFDELGALPLVEGEGV